MLDSFTPDSRSAHRRNFLKLSLAGGLVASVGAIGAYAQEQGENQSDEGDGRQEPEQRGPVRSTARPMPIVDARFPVEIASGVFMLPDKRIPLVPNVGIVVGSESVLVVDCGLGIKSAENVLAVARRLAPGRRIILTTTHAHPEHGFGAQVFKPDAHIYYNRAQADYLARSGEQLLTGFRTGVLPPDQRRLLDDVVLIPPDETYNGARATLDLGGRRVEFHTWGTAHSPGDQIVHLPDDQIVFAGDLLEERMFPIVPLFPPMITAGDIDSAKWDVALNDILRLEPRLIVPGHGNLAGMELPQAVLGYFGAVRKILSAHGQQNGELQSAVRALYPTWENPEFIQPALEYFRQRT